MTDHTAQTAETGDVGTLREAFDAVDDGDWKRLDLLLGQSGYGKFWRGVFTNVQTALAATPAQPQDAAPALGDLRLLSEAAMRYAKAYDAASAASRAYHVSWDVQAAAGTRSGSMDLKDADEASTAARLAESRAAADLKKAARTLAAAPATPPADGGTEGLREAVEAAFREGWRVNASPAKGTPEAEGEFSDLGQDSSYLNACETEDWNASKARATLSSRTPAGAAGDPVGENAIAFADVIDPNQPLNRRKTHDQAAISGDGFGQSSRGVDGVKASAGSDQPQKRSGRGTDGALCEPIGGGEGSGSEHGAGGLCGYQGVSLSGLKSAARPTSPAPAASAGGEGVKDCVLASASEPSKVGARERIARIIDPETFRFGAPDYYGPDGDLAWYSSGQRVALKKADKILIEPAYGWTVQDDTEALDDVLFAFLRYVENPTPFEVTWWTRHFPQFAQEIREHAVEVIDMNFMAARTMPSGSSIATASAEPKSFILRDCACCYDQPTVPPYCPACHGAGGFTRYHIADGMIAQAPAASLERGPYDPVRGWMAEGCCSACSPCSHQKREPYSICETCQKAKEAGV